MKRLSLSLLLLLSTLAYAGEKVLYQFQGGMDGYFPNGPLVADQAGNFYGTTFYGGDENCNVPYGCGTVFELSPDGHGGWTEAILYRFSGKADGQNPYAGLILDSQGNLYGTTAGLGGNCAPKCGSAFELSPGLSGWTITVLHAFKGGKDGGKVLGCLTADSAGNLYGTTLAFGPKGYGTVFRLSYSGKRWALKTLRAFGLDQHGSDPQGSLVIGPDGIVYGAANFGGTNGYGVVYSLARNAKGKWTEELLHTFPGGKGGGNPTFGLSSDSTGNLYGIATNTDRNSDLVYQLSPNSQGKWTEKTIYRFAYPSSGQPDSAGGNVFVDRTGNAFGFGGGGSARIGTIYELSQSGGEWTETLLYSFEGTSGGILPAGPPIVDTNGNLYGVTVEGGGSGCSGNGCGVVFEFTP